MRRPALLALLLVLAGCGASDGRERAPDFSAPGLDGRPFRLADHRGEVVVLNFWATWCAPCLAEMPAFIELQEELRGEGVVFVGVSQDRGGAAEVRPFAERLGVNYPLVLDPARDVARLYGGAEYIPTTFVIDREGFVHASKVGALSRTLLLGMLEGLVSPPALRPPAGPADPEMAHRPGAAAGSPER